MLLSALLRKYFDEFSFIADSDVIDEQQHQTFIVEQNEWVAENAASPVVGFIAIRTNEADWNIAELSVSEHWQRRGIECRNDTGQASWYSPFDANHFYRRTVECTLLSAPRIQSDPISSVNACTATYFGARRSRRPSCGKSLCNGICAVVMIEIQNDGSMMQC